MKFYHSLPWLNRIFVILACTVINSNMMAQVDVELLLESNSADTLVVKQLSQAADEIKFDNPTDAMRLSIEAIDISNRLEYSKGLIFNYKLLGHINYQLQEYDKAIHDFQMCLEHSKKVNDSSSTTICYSNIGAIFYTRGVNNRALDYYLQALNYAEYSESGVLFNNIGLIYFKEKKYDDALAYYTKSLEIKKELGDEMGVGVAYNNIGDVYKEMEKYDIATFYFEKSYAISNKIDDKEGAVFSLNNFGELEKRKNELDSSITYFKKALDISESINNQFLTAQSLYNVGHSYYLKKEYPKAKLYLERCYEISEELEILTEIEKSSRLLSAIYKQENNYEAAYKYLAKNKDVSDSLNQSKSENQLLKIKLDYDYKIEEEQAKRRLEIRKNEHRKEKLRLTIIIFVVIILLLIVIFLFIRAKYRMRVNRVEKEKVEIRKESLEIELEFKNKEIIEKVLKIIEKNELIESTVKRLHEFSLSLPSKSKTEVKQIINELKSMEMKNQWNEFHHYFTMIHSQFFENLEKDFPDLTTNEKRLSAYLKLNMSTKDIASLTFQNYKSIEVARTRLRKRFELTNTDISFQEFFSKYN